jgi:hypothetical protein
VFHRATFREPWYLLVPPDSASQLPTAEVVGLYRAPHAHRADLPGSEDPPGPPGVRLEVDIAPRLGRLLLALTVAYTLAVLLGACRASRRVRQDCEVLRATPATASPGAA